MNICLFSASSIKQHRGGVADYTYWAARALTERGHHVLCITTSAEACAPDAAGTLEMLDASSDDLEGQVEQLLQLHGIELVWMQTLHARHVNLCRSACDAVGAKLVCHLHVNPAASMAGYTDCLAGDWYECRHGRRVGAFLYALMRYPFCYWRRSLIERRRLRFIYQCADAFVLLSESFKEEFCRVAGMTVAPKLHALSNPLLLAPPAVLPEKRKEVLYVGRLPWQHKRVDRLLKAWSRVEADFPDWQLTIVGEGAAQDLYKELGRELKLKRVSFEGKQDPRPYYARARIFCMTSSFEGFGLVLIEAQAAGCVPVVFESYASVHDIIDDGINGCLVKPFDIAAYAETLGNLMRDEATLNTMAEAARKSVARFDSERIITRVESLLEGVADDALKD